MSGAHQYHRPDSAPSPEDDGDSDSDLDLQELDPITSSSFGAPSSPRRSKDNPRSLQNFKTRIPLRNLRVGRRSNRRRAEDDRYRDENAEDLRGLIEHDDEPQRRRGRRDVGRGDGSFNPGSNDSFRGQRNQSMLSRITGALKSPTSLFRQNSLGLDISGAESEAPEVDHDPSTNRIVDVGQSQTKRYPPNAVSNAKYTPWSFLPRTLYNEFSFFINMYFLLVALSQIIKVLRIGVLATYIAPLAFVISITLGKEALDDIARRRRDAEANSESYVALSFQTNNAGNGVLPEKRSRPAKSKQRDVSQRYDKISPDSQNPPMPVATVTEVKKASKDLKVGDVVKLEKGQRVPADMVILKSYSDSITSVEEPGPTRSSIDDSQSNSNQNETAATQQSTGEAFIRTDQLDGETDWKLRLTSPLTQSLAIGDYPRLKITAGKPDKRVNEFVGMVELVPRTSHSYDPHISEQESAASPAGNRSAPLNIDNTAWANTILASSSTVLGVVVYTGAQTRQALSTSPSRSKTGLLEYEINSLTKILCFLTLTLSFILVALQGFEKPGMKWYISVTRFLILFSTIVPVSLRVNLDMGKTVYAYFIQHDKGIPGTVVRTSTIPEDLGRIEYLLSDKTGTLTQNEMEMKKIHVGTVSYANEAMDEVASYVRQGLSIKQTSDENRAQLITPSSAYIAPSNTATRTRREIGTRVRDVVLALALCHNVTPTTEEKDGQKVTEYQASSPDEIAIVRWTESVGLRLLQRDRESMTLQSCDTNKTVVYVKILNIFPFTSEGKRMGIIVKFSQYNGPSTQDDQSEIWFYQKGADTVMASIVAENDWLEEETANMAREGLRTLVVGRKKLSESLYDSFTTKYSQVSLSLQNRDSEMAEVVKEYLECDLELLGVTGVEDKLQRDVKPSLELLRNAGIKIWMLTGDKVETARCVAISSKLVARGQYVHTIAKLKRKDVASESLDFLRGKTDSCLLIDGESLALMLTHFRESFISVAVRLPAVVACRCSPTQKADIAKLIRAYTRKRVCCIGDGGNDVSMIQAADVGVGIVGKEGRQASLAADFSIEQFCYLTKLLVWHGRNSYKRSAKLSQFVIHRGLIISVCQTLYSIATKFEPNALYLVSQPHND